MHKTDDTSIFAVDPDEAGCRLDRWLRRRLKLSRLSDIYRLIRTGGVKVNGRRCRENFRLSAHDNIVVAISPAEFQAAADRTTGQPAQLAETGFYQRNFRVLFEDENLLVCDKPVNLVVHPGTGHTRSDTLWDLAIAHIRSTTAGRRKEDPFLVHRLDRDTSGVILFAKNRQTLGSLHESLRAGTMRKKYFAVCHGQPHPAEATIDAALEKNFSPNDGTKMRVSPQGLRALSSYRVLETKSALSRVAIELHTGRTHQIRVHMAHIACPVLGDIRYGDPSLDNAVFAGRPQSARRLYLHAGSIGFYYPGARREVMFESLLPPAFDELWTGR